MARIALPPAFLTTPLAHRGFHDAAKRRPENSVAAFDAAIEAGYGVELDVQITADGQAVVFHDETLDRLTERSGRLASLTAAELGQIALRNSAQTIPSLSQVLKTVAGRVPVLIEIKAGLEMMLPGDGQLETAVARALSNYHGPVAVMSFNPHCVAQMARLAPDVPRGTTTEDFDPIAWPPLSDAICTQLREIRDYDRTQSSFISHKASDLARPRVAALKSAGAAILCWTIRSAEAEEKARQIADNITFEGYSPAHPA